MYIQFCIWCARSGLKTFEKNAYSNKLGLVLYSVVKWMEMALAF